MDDPCEVLGLAPGAGAAAIAAAYRKLVRRYPPELAPERFARIQEAHAWLTSPARRMVAARVAPEETLELLFPLPEVTLRPLEPPLRPAPGEALEELLAPLQQAALRRLLRDCFTPPPPPGDSPPPGAPRPATRSRGAGRRRSRRGC